MAYDLTLPARNKARRARMALDDGAPDFTIPKLIPWVGTNMSRKEILDLTDSLRDLAAKRDDDDTDARRDRGQAAESRRAVAAKGFAGRYPAAAAIKREL